MNNKKIAYIVVLSLFSLLIMGSIWNYVFNYEETLANFTELGYPEHLIHSLTVAQFVGLAVIIFNKGKWIVEWAYAGFFLNFIFAIVAHYMAKQGNGAAAVICLIMLWITYVLHQKLELEAEEESHEALKPA